MRKPKRLAKEEWIQQAKAKIDGISIDGASLINAVQDACFGISKTEIADILGVSTGTVSDYTSSKKRALPSLSVAIKAAVISGVDLRELVSKNNTIKS